MKELCDCGKVAIYVYAPYTTSKKIRTIAMIAFLVVAHVNIDM
jgi:hypothetical protein